jgi:hypothetical protein
MKVTIKAERITAIKLVRILTANGLKESKDIVDSVMPHQFGSGANTQVQYVDLTIETQLTWQECSDEAARAGIEIERVGLIHSMTITEADDNNVIIALKSSKISGELFVDKQFAADCNILGLLGSTLKM